jgi:hypothetical protein
MDVARRDLGVRRQNRLGAVERRVPNRGFDKSHARIVKRAHIASSRLGFRSSEDQRLEGRQP